MQGFYGKLPGLGDFVTRELPRSFLDTWDDWLQRSLADSKTTLGEAWLQTYLNSPIWRFVTMPGVCGEKGWAGILMPSVDKVGRYFPLTIASSLGENAQPFQVVVDAADWFDAAEVLALTVLHEEKVDPDLLASSVAGLDDEVMLGMLSQGPAIQGGEWGLRLTGTTSESISSVVCHELVHFQVGHYSIWWTPGSEDSASMGLVAPGLPAPQSFASLLAGRWNEMADDGASQEPPLEAGFSGEVP